MLTITYKGEDNIIGEAYWHIGKHCPLLYEEVATVMELLADGDELEFIERILPQYVAKGIRVQRFFGDIAKQIVSIL